MPPVTPGLWRNLGDRSPVWPGRHHPLGASWSPEATNFAVHAPNATAVWVCLFDDEGAESRHQLTEQTLGIWHGALPDVPPGTPYGFRADGPWQPELGLRFNVDKLLLDPFARAISGDVTYEPAIFAYDLDAPEERSTTDSAPYVPRSVVVGADDFDWQGDQPLQHRWRDTVVYEAHVKGMTMLHDRVPEELRGTYAGLATPAVVDYLKDLGVTAVELLPIHQFASEPALIERGLVNYWGYNSIGFFAPHNAYSAAGDRGQQVTEFKHDGAEPARRRPRGDPRRGLQPHRRGRRDRTHAELPGARRPLLLPGRRRRARRASRRHLLGRDRLRQHRRRVEPVRAAADPRLAALLGHRDARRRLPLRPDVRAHPGRPRDRHDQPLPHRDRPGPGAPARQADRRAVGRLDGRLPGRRVPAAVGGVERPVPRRDPRLLARRELRASGPSPPGWPARPTCTPTTGARRTPRSTSSPRTTASRCATW